MSVKAILSSKGQLVIPKHIRILLGLHSGSEVNMELKHNNVLELHPVKNDIRDFFGRGKSKVKNKVMTIEEMDVAIMKAISE